MKLLFIMLIALSEDAIAGDEDTARQLFEQGVRASQHGRWEEALSAFERSLKLWPRSSTEFNIGTTLLKLGRGPEAVPHFERYLEISDPKSDFQLRVEAMRILDQLRAKSESMTPPDDFSSTSTQAVGQPVAPKISEEIAPPPPPPTDEGSIWTSPAFIIAAVSVAVVAGAIGIGFAVGSTEGDPIAGTRGVVLRGLEPR